MAGEDPAYLERVVQLPCCAGTMSSAHPCMGPRQAHHPIRGRVARPVRKGADRRAHDHQAVCLCTGHHDAFHGARGPFKVMVKRELDAWEAEQVLRTQRVLKPLIER